MKELLKKIYDTVLVYDKDIVKNSKVVDEEIEMLMKPYKDKLSEAELDELYDLLCTISLTAKQAGFEMGMKFTIKTLVSLLSS